MELKNNHIPTSLLSCENDISPKLIETLRKSKIDIPQITNEITKNIAFLASTMYYEYDKQILSISKEDDTFSLFKKEFVFATTIKFMKAENLPEIDICVITESTKIEPKVGGFTINGVPMHKTLCDEMLFEIRDIIINYSLRANEINTRPLASLIGEYYKIKCTLKSDTNDKNYTTSCISQSS
jgi:hypothetical protein